jgi:acyl-[acyl-carrier-protein]-phospholipid O-acyltransferase / long-chain-fatty-acid--[acyl-carrier-protein] ligase
MFRSFLYKCLRFILKLLYRVEVFGKEHLKKLESRTVIVANHTSFLDAVLIVAFFPEETLFAVNTYIAKKWWMKPAALLFNLLPLDPTNPLATKKIIEQVKSNKKVVIFPEGRITVTGTLMKIYEGPGLIATAAKAQILPLRIEGAQYSPFSRLQGKVRSKLFPKISLTFLEPRKIEIPQDIKGRARRKKAGAMLYNLMSNMIFETSTASKHLFNSLLDARKVHGGNSPVVEDITRVPLTYDKLIVGSVLIGKKIRRLSQEREALGILLPNSAANVVTLFGTILENRVAAMLNFSLGSLALLSACKTGQIKTVISSKAFIEKGKLLSLVGSLQEQGIRIIYLEDLIKKNLFTTFLSIFFSKIILFKTLIATSLGIHKVLGQCPLDPALLLFTSGSEGSPKGVMLSHRNLQSNRFQVAARVDFNSTDTVFNALPMFHSFGLSIGTLLPILSGIRTFLYPSPLHYRIIPEMVYDCNATILFGTDTFLRNYAKHASPYDFHALRYVFTGAEKLKPDTASMWHEKFGIRILEGYGATETSPVISINSKMHYKKGTVGRVVPGIEYTLEKIDGIDQGGKLLVKGPNIMCGYLKHDNPGILQPLPENWYDTGDIVTIDDEGYVTIQGRSKRFAKIGGEMVSLAVVEEIASVSFKGSQNAALIEADPKKGEAIILFTDFKDATKQLFLEQIKLIGASELHLPKQIRFIASLPFLPTGKIDYQALKAIYRSTET